jgi:hypothetical protein
MTPRPPARESILAVLLSGPGSRFARPEGGGEHLVELPVEGHRVSPAGQRADQRDRLGHRAHRGSALLADQGVLRPDVTEAQAADLLWLLTSFDAFDALLPAGRCPRSG